MNDLSKINDENPVDLQSYLDRMTAGDDMIKGLEEKYSDAVEIAKDFKGLELALSDVKKTRTGIESTRKIAISGLQKVQKRVNEKAKSLTSRILEVEIPLLNEKDRILKERAEEKERVERVALEKFNTRTARLFEAGFTFDGTKYTVGTFYTTVDQVNTLTDDEFEAVVKEGAEEYSWLESKRLEFEEFKTKQERAKGRIAEQAQPEPETEKLELQFSSPFGDADDFSEIPAPAHHVGSALPPVSDDLSGYRPAGYQMGFAACQMEIIRLLETTGPIKKSELIEKIKGLTI